MIQYSVGADLWKGSMKHERSTIFNIEKEVWSTDERPHYTVSLILNWTSWVECNSVEILDAVYTGFWDAIYTGSWVCWILTRLPLFEWLVIVHSKCVLCVFPCPGFLLLNTLTLFSFNVLILICFWSPFKDQDGMFCVQGRKCLLL